MALLELDIDGVHLGSWLSIESVWSLMEEMSRHYQKRLGRFHIGDAEDLQQAAAVGLCEWVNANEGAERIREVTALEILHTAMVAEVRGNRRQSVLAEDVWAGLVDERIQLNGKQCDFLHYFTSAVSQVIGRPQWEVVWLKLGLGWSHSEITAYFRRKKDDRQHMPAKKIDRLVRQAVQRFTENADRSIIDDVIRLKLLERVSIE